MSVKRIADIFRIGVDILTSTVDAVTKTVLFQTGDVVSGDAFSDKAELWSHCGFIYRPPLPVAGTQSAQCISIRTGKNDVVFGSRDPRGQQLAGSLGPGETCVYAPGHDGKSQGRILLKDNGSVSIYTTQGNTSTGSSVTIQCNPDGSLAMVGPYGGITIDSAGIKIVHTSGSGIQMDSTGVTMIGKAMALNGSTVSLGANAVNPVLWGASGPAGVASLSVKVAL